jgi:ABC-type cobalt transport system, permease component
MSSIGSLLRSIRRWLGAHRWRTVDIVVASTIAVAFGVIFWAWTLLYEAVTAAFTFYPPAQAVMYGVWLVPAVLGPPPSSRCCSAPPGAPASSGKG